MPTPRKSLPWGKERLPLQSVRDKVAALAAEAGLPAELVPWKNSWANNPRYVRTRHLRINGHLVAIYSIQRKVKLRNRWYAEGIISQQASESSKVVIYHVRVDGEPERVFIAFRKDLELSFARGLHIPLHHTSTSCTFPWHRCENQWELFRGTPTSS